ncbi:MAG: aminopeptidase [Anaerolineales bacterium]|nr:aminopeptidase [Anaerolineales bacterium]
MHHLPDVGSSARWHDNKGNNDTKDEMDATGMTFPTTDDLQRYATLLIKTGVNLQPGQGLVIRGELAHAALVRLAVAEAYRAGASYVQVDWYDGPHVGGCARHCRRGSAWNCQLTKSHASAR